MRDEALMPLTHDHHHALAAARRLGLAAGADGPERRERAEDFISFFQRDTLQHFREEEEEVFPLIVGETEAAEALKQVMIEHLQIHAVVASLQHELEAGEPTATTMESVATLLQSHIRFEEKVVFPLVETLADRDALGQVALAERDRTGQTT